MWRPTNAQWWILLTVALFIVLAWPPDTNKSLGIKLTNWAADPRNRLPILPGPLPLGQGDDMDVVNEHDLQTQLYDELYDRGGWMRLRLALKVANDPFDPGTERQLLVGIGVVAAFLAWRLGAPNN